MAMRAEPYIEALLVDEDLADQVWELWDVGLIPDELAVLAWCILFDREVEKLGYLGGTIPTS